MEFYVETLLPLREKHEKFDNVILEFQEELKKTYKQFGMELFVYDEVESFHDLGVANFDYPFS